MNTDPGDANRVVLGRLADTSAVLKMRFFFFQAEDGIRDHCVTGVQTCALPISWPGRSVAAIRSGTAARAPGPIASSVGTAFDVPARSKATSRGTAGAPAAPNGRSAVTAAARTSPFKIGRAHV